MTEYTYSILNDFSNQQVFLDNLISEIEKAELSVVLNKILVEGDSVKIYFEDELASGDDLDDIISNHDSVDHIAMVSTCEYCKVFPMYNVNYNFLGLQKEEIFDDYGCLIEKNMYLNYNSETKVFSNKILRDVCVYTRTNDMVVYRTETITWYDENEYPVFIKSISKNYTLIDSMNEGIRRRENLINKAKEYGFMNITGTYEVSGEPTMPNAYYFFTVIKDEVTLYINGMKDYLINKIENSQESYLTSTIKTNLVDILKYWS